MREVVRPGAFIGYRKDGRAIRLIAGGSVDDPAFVKGTQDDLSTVVPPSPPGSLTPPPAQMFSAEDLERARQEEKDKLYKRLDKQGSELKELKGTLTEWQKDREDRAAEKAAAQQAEADAVKRQAEEEMSAKQLIAVKEREWQERLDRLEQEREQERALLEKERNFSALKAFISQRAREEADSIAPELIDLIGGNTQEEVERSIATLRDKTQAILANVSNAQIGARAAQRGVSTAGYAATGPMDNEPGQKTLTQEEIKAMPMSEWAKIRGQVIGATTQANRGLFG